ncbi:fimbrial protein [Serratia sp. DD3]|uniref:fimbrial protein n=1 Tax=Serratia sp. DD3 TaxID=1410619 RepID=UPI0004D37EF9|nr:fimbrial protein [Serratia sp. DD3]KEY56847.1 P pilus assembly protein, pilin FimA [Serratia sp. DD3]
MFHLKKILFVLCVFYQTINSGLVYAVDMNFTGNLVVPPCVINGGRDVFMEWGNVDLTKVPAGDIGFGASKSITLLLSCPYAIGVPNMYVTGDSFTGPSFYRGAVKTTKEDVIVYLHATGVDGTLRINGKTPITLTGAGTEKSVTLTGYLARTPGFTSLTPGPFNGIVALNVVYE